MAADVVKDARSDDEDEIEEDGTGGSSSSKHYQDDDTNQMKLDGVRRDPGAPVNGLGIDYSTNGMAPAGHDSYKDAVVEGKKER